MNPSGAAREDQALSRTLARRHVTMISIGGIIGAGLFVGSSVAIAAVGPAVIASYILAGLLILCVMRMLAEMASIHPGIGAFTEFARLGLGHWAGFTSGWLYWYFWVVVVAIEAIAGATLLRDWVPLPVWQIELVLIVVMSAVNLASARAYGEFEFWFASLKVAAILIFIAVGVAFILHSTPSRAAAVQHLGLAGGFAPRGTLSIFSGVTSVIFALCGAEIATIAAAESAEGPQTIAKLTLSVAMRVLLFFVGSMLVIVAVVPWSQITPGTSPFTTALERIGVPGSALIMRLIVLTAVLSCLNSAFYVSSRVLFTLAERGDAPQWLIALNDRQVPARAILAGSVFGYGAVVASIVSPERLFAFLVNASGANMLIIYFLISAAQIRLGKIARRGSRRVAVAMWWFPWLSYAVIAAILAVLWAMLLQRELAVQLYASLVALLLVMALYWSVRRRSRVPLQAAYTGTAE